jgi:uncharacterized membrane protein YfcA
LATVSTLQWILTPLFFVIAFVYSSVGLGGGSSYAALMAIFGVSHVIIPTTALGLNIAVTSIGLLNFHSAGHVRPGLILPFLAGSIPMAYLGGALELPARTFEWLLLISLVLVAARIYLLGELRRRVDLEPAPRWAGSLLLGGTLGFVAGTVGIGGGIYLVPLIIYFGLGREKEAAAAGTVFVLVNSVTGLLSRLRHQSLELSWIVPLLVAVVVGGYLGSHFGSKKFSPRTVQQALGLVILIAIVLLTRRLIA